MYCNDHHHYPYHHHIHHYHYDQHHIRHYHHDFFTAGTTGAGRAAKESFLYCEVTDGISAYGVATHRHAPEIGT